MWFTRLSCSPRKLAPGTRATQGTSRAWSMRAIASLDQSSSREVEGWGVSARFVGFIVYVPPVSPASALEAGPARVDVLGGADRRAPRAPSAYSGRTPRRKAIAPWPGGPRRFLEGCPNRATDVVNCHDRSRSRTVRRAAVRGSEPRGRRSRTARAPARGTAGRAQGRPRGGGERRRGRREPVPP